MDAELDDYYLEPGEVVYNRKVLMPHIVRYSGGKPVICLVNPTDNYKIFKKNVVIANANEV